MVVAMVAVGMVQVSINEVVHMVAVRNGFVAAARTMDVTRCVSCAGVLGRAGVRIRWSHGDDVLVNVLIVRMVQVAVMQVVDVALVNHGGVAASWSMLMIMVLMVGLVACGHNDLLRAGRLQKSCGLSRMGEDVVQQGAYMLVGQGVEDVLGVASARDQPCGMQGLQASRNTAELGLLVLDKLGNAALSLGKPQEQPKP